jgi:hypothetical protein
MLRRMLARCQSFARLSRHRDVVTRFLRGRPPRTRERRVRVMRWTSIMSISLGVHDFPKPSAESRFAERNDGTGGARRPAPCPEVLCTTVSGVRRRDESRLTKLALNEA